MQRRVIESRIGVFAMVASGAESGAPEERGTTVQGKLAFVAAKDGNTVGE
jgi:hypothetical protein